MSTSLAEVYLHIVFTTKRRTPWLQSKPLRMALYEYIAGICRNLKGPALCIGCVEDLVHILLRLSRDHSLADTLREIKRSSTVWIRQHPDGVREFHWQVGYSVFSISPSHLAVVTDYIQTQEKHHQKIDVKEELLRILKKYKAQYDERFLFD